MKTRRNLAVIVAGGTGTRMGSDMPKQYIEILGKPVLAWAIAPFERCRFIDEIILVAHEEYLAYASQAIVDKFGFKKINKITTGGETRQESVLAGLTACPRATDKVAIHDGARPIIDHILIEKLLEEASETQGAIPAIKAKDTIKLVDDNMMSKTLPRDRIYLAQTPQVFTYQHIFEIHKKAADSEFKASDDAMLAEQYGLDVKVIEGSYRNIKITTPEDLILAKELMR